MRRVALLLLLLAPSRAPAQGDSIQTRLQRAIALREGGDRAGAARAFRSLVDVYNARGRTLSSADLVSVAVAVTYLGADEPQYFKDALVLYDRAIEADPANLVARVKLAELFLEKYNSAEARRTLAAALARAPEFSPALLAEARRRDFDGAPGADSLVDAVLRREPDNADARVLRARFLADAEDFTGAVRETERALRVRPDDANALALGAALRFVAGDSAGYTDLRRRHATRYPGDAGIDVARADLLARVRQYEPAARAAREGVAVDPRNWRAHALLGTNLLRLGRVADARAALETAFAGDPYDVWTKNTLDLLDTFAGYDEIASGRFALLIEKAESRILSLYLGELADRAYATFSARYGFTPSTPIRVEVYRSHADFSVRTVGLPGLGALGVSFGNTVAFDSPAAKDAGSFNWGSTAWHELAHTFTLGASDMRVPRWLSEGLSVYEERQARPGWGQHVTPAFLQAYADGKLPPVSRLNDGFVRPAFPQQVLLSYYEASLVCEMIVAEYGTTALPAMLREYGRGAGTEQVVRRVLRTDLPALDRRFDEYVRRRFAKAFAAIADRSYQQQLALGRGLLERGNLPAARAALDSARRLFPEFGGAESAYPPLVRVLVADGDARGAAEVMSTMARLGEVPFEVHVQLADLWLQLADTARAADALEAAMYVNPFDVAQHQRLAALYATLGQRPKAIRERRAVVALDPVDRAEAYYQLALAYRDGGQRTEARRSVLRALEDAPNFVQAQELLLALHAPEGTRP